MKKSTNILVVLLAVFSTMQAQVKLKGAMSFSSKKKMNLEYQRQATLLADTLYKTTYSIYSAPTEISYELEVIHNPFNKLIGVHYKDSKAGTLKKLSNINYTISNSSIIFTNESNLDTSINLSKPYSYLLFFQDTSRTFVNVNTVTFEDSTCFVLDKMSKQLQNEHLRIANTLLQNPSLAKSIQRFDRIHSKRINSLEQQLQVSIKKAESLGSTSNNMIEDLMKCRNSNEFMAKNYDSLTNKVYSLVNFSNSYSTTYKPVWDRIIDSLISMHCNDYYFENTDIKYVIKLTTDTVGAIVSTDLVFPLSASALSSKDNYLFSMICGIIKKGTYPVNRVNVYGKSYPVKSSTEKDLFVSIKNRKDKIVFTDKDNIIFNDTKLSLTDEMKAQVNGKLYVGAKPGKYSVKVCSFTVNDKVKEMIKEIDF